MMYHTFHYDPFNNAAFCIKNLTVKYWTKNDQNTRERTLFCIWFDRDIFRSCVRALSLVSTQPSSFLLPYLISRLQGQRFKFWLLASILWSQSFKRLPLKVHKLDVVSGVFSPTHKGTSHLFFSIQAPLVQILIEKLWGSPFGCWCC